MATLDSATEWRRLSELYGRMANGELLALARKQSELTDVAHDALANEMRFRKLKLEAEEPAVHAKPSRELDPAYEEDRQLVQICTVWSLADALQVQQLLDRAGIPFVMGKEMATDASAVTSNFAEGVAVGIMQIGAPWARQALQYYEPLNEPKEERVEELGEIPVYCPKCRSSEVVFDQLIGERPKTAKDSPQLFEWACDACGYRWKDDGVLRGESKG